MNRRRAGRFTGIIIVLILFYMMFLYRTVFLIANYIVPCYLVWLAAALLVMVYYYKWEERPGGITIGGFIIGCFLFICIYYRAASYAFQLDAFEPFYAAAPLFNLPVLYVISIPLRSNRRQREIERAITAAHRINAMLDEKIQEKRTLQTNISSYLGQKKDMVMMLELVRQLDEQACEQLENHIQDMESGGKVKAYTALNKVLGKYPEYRNYDISSTECFHILDNINKELERYQSRKIMDQEISLTDAVAINKRYKEYKRGYVI